MQPGVVFNTHGKPGHLGFLALAEDAHGPGQEVAVGTQGDRITRRRALRRDHAFRHRSGSHGNNGRRRSACLRRRVPFGSCPLDCRRRDWRWGHWRRRGGHDRLLAHHRRSRGDHHRRRGDTGWCGLTWRLVDHGRNSLSRELRVRHAAAATKQQPQHQGNGSHTQHHGAEAPGGAEATRGRSGRCGTSRRRWYGCLNRP